MEAAIATTADEWELLCTDSFVPLSVDRVSGDFRGVVRQRRIGELITASAVECGSTQLRRTRSLIRSGFAEDYLFVVHLAGRGLVEQDSRTVNVPVGSAVLYDASRPYTLAFPGPHMRELVLHLPRAFIDHRDSDSRRACARAIPPATATLRVLTAMITEVVQGGDQQPCSASGSESISWAICELLRDLLCEDAQAGTLGKVAMLRTLEQFVRDNLADTSLTPQTLASRHSISLRYLYRLFEERSTSPAACIREARLQHARRQLTQPSQAHQTVAYIARSSGFQGTTTFTRAFRRRFGRNPAEYRADHVVTLNPARSAG